MKSTRRREAGLIVAAMAFVVVMAVRGSNAGVMIGLVLIAMAAAWQSKNEGSV